MTSELPEGWALVNLDDACEVNPGKPTVDALAPDALVSFVPMPAVDAGLGMIVGGRTRPFAEVRKGFTAFRNEDVIMAKITPCMENGKAAIARNLENGIGFGTTEFHVMRTSQALLPDYLYHYIRQESFRQGAEAEMTGSVGQKRVPVDYINQVVLPLPPLAEQRRIVAKVEQILARANAARERLGRVPATLKRFRQSVLAAACSGRLTADWREGQSIDTLEAQDELPTGWRFEPVSALVTAQNGRSFPSKQYDGTGVRLLRPGNLHGSGELTWTEKNTACLPATFAEEFPEFLLSSGELLMNLTAQSLKDEFLGRVCLKRDSIPALLNQRICRFRPATNYDVRPYLFIYFKSREFRKYVDSLDTGSLIRHMHTKQVVHHLVPLPPLPEQHEIVRRVSALFALADGIEAKLAAARKRVDALTQAVLAKAFRGELVPTEAELARAEGRTYEPASALLERVRAERDATPKPGRRRKG